MNSEQNLRDALRESREINDDFSSTDASIKRDERTGHMPSEDILKAAVAAGVQAGIKELLQDDDLMAKFWKAGYHQLSNQAGDNASQWVGKRILVAAATALLGWLIVYLAKNGGHT